MIGLLGNIRYALRQFRQAPLFTATAVLTLALGIGGTTAIFSLIHSVMMKSLPVKDPAALYRVGSGDDCCVEGGPQDEWGFFSVPLGERLKQEVPEFEETTLFQAGRGRMSVRREGVESSARPLVSEYVDGHYFSTLGVGAYVGRVFGPEDDQQGAAPVLVMSHRAWQTTYGGDPKIVGSTFVVEGHPFTVVGIAPAGFFGEMLESDPPELWIPLRQEGLITNNKGLLTQSVSAWVRMFGRLKPGATTAAMDPRLTGVLRNWMQFDSGYPSNWLEDIKRVMPKQTLKVIPAGAGVAMMQEEYGKNLKMLLAVCGLVLLIACSNVANLLLARGVTRRGQTAVRMAVGASPKQIVAQALLESVILAIGGAVAGLAVAVGAARLLLSLAFHDAHYLPISASPSWMALGFAFLLALITGVIFGAAPAWLATRTHPAEALHGTGRGNTDRSSVARKTLLVVQATLSVVLVAGATMLGRSLNKLEHQDFGFEQAGRVEVSFNGFAATHTQAELLSLNRQLEQQMRSIPGVQSADLAMYNPLTDNWGELVFVDGHPPAKMDEQSGSSWDRVSANYLQDLGVKLARGRFFTEADNETGASVAIVNEAFVKRFFKPEEDPMNQYFGIDLPENSKSYRIVGIVRDAKFAGFALGQPARPMYYLPMTQSLKYANPLLQRLEDGSHFMGGILLVTNLPTGQLEPLITRKLAELDPGMTLNSVRTMQKQVELSFDQERAVASLAGLFGMIALLLAAVGLYGVTAYSVAQKTNEIGIRMALGADRGKVMQMVLAGAFTRVFIGLLLGLPLAVGAGKLISSQLYGVRWWDPPALTVATCALTLCSLAAALIPANRAAGISPMTALRSE